MKTKYYKYTLKGEHSADDAQRAVGAAGLVVRVDNTGGQTNLYIASQDTGAASGTQKATAPAAAKYVEVSESDVTKI